MDMILQSKSMGFFLRETNTIQLNKEEEKVRAQNNLLLCVALPLRVCMWAYVLSYVVISLFVEGNVCIYNAFPWECV